MLYLREDAAIDHLRALFAPDLLLANSEVMRRRAHDRGFECAFVPSPIREPGVPRDRPRDHVLLVNFHPVYGGDLALEIAAACPRIPFVFQDSWDSRPHRAEAMSERIAARRLDNVQVRPFSADPVEVFGGARFLLVPYRERIASARPRSVLEALSCGIPVVASDLPGLREAAGEAAIYVPPDAPVEAWRAALEGALGGRHLVPRSHGAGPRALRRRRGGLRSGGPALPRRPRPGRTGLMRALLRRLWRAYRRVHLTLVRDRKGDRFVPHWEARWTDDVRANRVLHLALRPLRRLALRAPDRRRFSIVIVNWNSQPFLADVLRAIRRFSPDEVEILVVDNGSADGSRSFLRAQRDVRAVLLPWNLGHAPALDLGFVLARGEYLVALDVDAFPVAEGWLERLAEPLEQGEAEVSGARALRGYVHPCCLMIRRRRFLAMRHTFVSRFRAGAGLGRDYWDTGESISIREGAERLRGIERTSVRGPYALGATFDGIVFHNGCSTRGPDPAFPELTMDEILRSWHEAVERIVGSPEEVR